MTENPSKINFYRITKGLKLYSFSDEMSNLPIQETSLGSYQKNCIEGNGHSVIDIEKEEDIYEEQYFKFDEDLVFTPAFIDQVLNCIETDQGSRQFILAENDFNDRFVLPHSKEINQNLHFNFFYINRKKPELVSYKIKQKLYPTAIRLPEQIVKSGQYKVYQCDTFISRMASPFHLLQANLALNLMRTIKWKKKFPEWIRQQFSKPNGQNSPRILKLLTKKGKNCSIHASAVVEACILEDNVTIGANCTVRLSHIGSGTNIQDNVSVVHSVIGKNNVIANNNHISMSLTYNDVYLIHGPYQFSVFGKSTAVFAVINCDIRLDNQNIKIPTDVGVIDSQQPLLGVAYGHGSKVGGGNIIAPGRIVPNDLHINPTDNIILDFN